MLIGVNNESLLDTSAIYIPDPAVAAHRVCYMGYFSRANCPPGCSSLIAEVTAPPGHELLGVSDSGLTEMLVRQLHGAGIINPAEVVATDVTTCPFGYVVYDRDYQRNVTAVREYFAGQGIELLGRFGRFEYINMDEVVRRAIELADRLGG